MSGALYSSSVGPPTFGGVIQSLIGITLYRFDLTRRRSLTRRIDYKTAEQ